MEGVLGGGGLLVYNNDGIPSRKLQEHTTPDDIEIVCVEINLKKQKWVIIGIYNPPNMNNMYFLDHLCKTIDLYNREYDNVVIMGDFNLEPSTEIIESLCSSYDLFNLVKEPICFKGQPKCYDLILTNCKDSFQNTEVFTTGFSHFHKMVFTILKTEFVKADPTKINYRDYSNFNSIHFRDELRKELSENPSTNNDYEFFQNTLCEVLKNTDVRMILHS